MSFIDTLAGNVSQDQTKQIFGQVQAPQQGTYQIPGLSGYTNTLGGLASQVPNAPNYGQMIQPQLNNQQALQQYFQNVGNGTQQTAADAQLQQGQQTAARNIQSGVTSAQGMSPALQMRQMLNAQATNAGQLAGQSAQQKLQEQFQGAQLANASSQAIGQQQMAAVQQQYQGQMQGIQAQQSIAQGIFNANAQQTNYNVEFAQNQQAYQMFQAQQQYQAAKDHAAAIGGLVHAGIGAVEAGAGAALTFGSMGALAPLGVGMMAGGIGQMGGAMGGGGGASPAMSQYLQYLQGQGQRPAYGNNNGLGAGNGDMNGGAPGSFVDPYAGGGGF